MRRVKILDAMEGKIGEWRLLTSKYNVLKELSGGQYIGPDGQPTRLLVAAQEFRGWWWQRNSAIKTFAKKHELRVVRNWAGRTYVTVEYYLGWFYLKDSGGNYLQKSSILGKSPVFGNFESAIPCRDDLSIKNVARRYRLRVNRTQ